MMQKGRASLTVLFFGLLLPLSVRAQTVSYALDAEQSQAGCQVNETFLRLARVGMAIGVSKDVSGDIFLDFDRPERSVIGPISVNVERLSSDDARRDRRIRREWLESSIYPAAVFSPSRLVGLPPSFEDGESYTFEVVGSLQVKERVAETVWQVSATVYEGYVEGGARTEILMSDFGVGPIGTPLLRTEDEVTLFFDFLALARE